MVPVQKGQELGVHSGVVATGDTTNSPRLRTLERGVSRGVQPGPRAQCAPLGPGGSLTGRQVGQPRT